MPGRDRRTAAGADDAPRPARGRSQRILRVALAALSLAVLATSVGGWSFYSYFNGKVTRVALHRTTKPPPAAAPGVENYLLVGTDSRAGSDGEYGDAPGQRSDTTMLVHLASDGTTTLVSFPRDTYVTIPAYTDASGTHHAAHKDKFNSAISDGGPSLLVTLVEQLTDIRIDHYVSMDLAGFKAITNAIGGVSVCVLPLTAAQQAEGFNNLVDKESGWSGHVGPNTLDGDQALAFVRARYSLPGGDLDRIKRQQQFIGAVFRKAMTSGVLTNPVKLEGLASTATSALTLDNQTSIGDLEKLATRMRGVGATSLRTETVPTHAPTPAEGAVDERGDIELNGVATSVQLYAPADLEKIVAPLGGRAEGYVPAEQTGGTAGSAGTVAASQVSVAVYNGSTLPGIASRATSALAAEGFHATNDLNVTPATYVASHVDYGAGQEAAARTVQAAVPGSVLIADAAISGVKLILGSSYAGIVTPTLTSTSTAPSTATSSAAPTATASTAPAAPNCTY